MKVFVTYENSFEKGLADNLVKVLKSIGAMLIYGKVTDKGVLLEDWQNKPKVKMECTAVSIAPTGAASVAQSISPRPLYPIAAEFEYRDGARAWSRVNLGGSAFTPYPEGARAKRKVPKPNTTKTGVTIRAIDLDDDHEGE